LINNRQLPIRREVSRRQNAIAIGLIILLAVSLFSMIFLFVIVPQSIPVIPPDEWTLIAEINREQESEGWEQASKVYQGIRNNILFFRVVWNESRQNIQGIFWKDSYEQTFSGTEGLVETNSSYAETRYLYIIMKSPSHAHEIVIMQLPQTPAEVPFLHNVKKVYKVGDDFTAIVGIIPTENHQVLPMNVQDIQVQEIQTGVIFHSSFEFYLSENLPQAMKPNY